MLFEVTISKTVTTVETCTLLVEVEDIHLITALDSNINKIINAADEAGDWFFDHELEMPNHGFSIDTVEPASDETLEPDLILGL